MTAVDIAERRARFRAFGFLILAVLTCGVMIVVRADPENDFTTGLWLGLLVGCADEGARENRRSSCTVGFWAAVGAALFFQLASHFNRGIGAEEVGQIVATAGIVSAMITFAILELRAAR